MYSNEDLNSAIKEGIFTQRDVDNFRDFIDSKRESKLVHEEEFRLSSSFNDIFVVIASILLLVSVKIIFEGFGELFSNLLIVAVSWGLSEYFVLKRRMSLPGIVLLFSFAIGIFLTFASLSSDVSFEYIEKSPTIAFIGTMVAIYIYWKRFKVPIAVALNISIVLMFVVYVLLENFESLKDWISVIFFMLGVLTFIIAMYWDSKDTKRVTNNNDVAFWLHLLAAPLIIHSLFLSLDIFENKIELIDTIVIVAVYIILSSISLIIDRRALMVSSLFYVLYALNELFKNYGFETNSFAIGGAILSISLLFLTAFWSKSRSILLKFMPQSIISKVPEA